MTNTGQLVCLMADGKVWSVAEIGKAIGIEPSKVYSMTGHMLRRGEISRIAIGQGYVLTPRGKARANAIASRSVQYAERLERESCQSRVKARERSVANLPLVTQARLLSPVSVFNLGNWSML